MGAAGSRNEILENYKDVLRSLNESTDDYLYICDLSQGKYWFYGGVEKKYNVPACCTIQEWGQIVHPGDYLALEEDSLLIHAGERSHHDMDYRLINKEGGIVWVNCRGTVQFDENGKPFAMIGRVSDTLFLHKVDHLTGLFNTVKLWEDLGEELYGDPTGYFLLLGIDNLKNINIHYGRSCGDAELQAVGKVLESLMGGPHRVYRLDGDRFAVRLPVEGVEEVNAFFDRLREALTKAGNCTISCGAASCREQHFGNGELLYQYAEDALDQAKADGKNSLHFFSSEEFADKSSHIALIEEMQASIQNGCEGFSLFYQPQIHPHTYSIRGAEALLRYDSPTRGRVFPNEFIPLLEKTGLIRPVGQWILKTALNQCRRWREMIPNFRVSVNISYVELAQPGIADQVLAILRESGVPGSALTLEVTESMQLQNVRHFNEIFQQWKQRGIDVAIDDFGTGYSSLSYLKSLNVDEIKIDRCFVSGIQESVYNYKLVNNIVELAQNLQIRICCEGVEELEELRVLERMEPSLLQGYLFARPCDPESLEKNYIRANAPGQEEWKAYAHGEQ